jgi:hypothetical protein
MGTGNKTWVLSFIWRDKHLEIWRNYDVIMSFDRETYKLLAKCAIKCVLILHAKIAIEIEKTIQDFTFKR